MKKKFKKLSLWSFLLSIAIYLLSYFVYHFVTPTGITLVWHPEPGKPYVTMLFSMLGVFFTFSSIMSLIVAHIFCED